MKNVDLFFNKLASNNSRLYKTAMLIEHKDNDLIKETIRLALDPFTQFYQRKIPKYIRSLKETNTLEFALGELYRFSSREVTGNAAINALSNLLSTLELDDAKVIERIISKDLKCGVSVSTVNAVWPKLISEYPVMLCSPFEQKLVDKIKFPAYAQMKMDGMRFNAIVKDGVCEFRSRNGKEINLLGNLEQEFIKMANGTDLVFDGELLVMFEHDYQFADRQTGNGILNKANKGTITTEEAALVHASVWDVIPFKAFTESTCLSKYEARFAVLSAMLEHQPSSNKKIWGVTSTVVKTLEEATAIFEQYLLEGYEGIILKDGRGIWEDKRAKHQIKFKGEMECDLKIVGIEEGTGKYVGKLGAIICESADSIIKVNVGSGFNDIQRSTLKDLVGKIVAVKYNARIKNKQGEESLFLPIFIEIREDKDEADLSCLIK